MGVSKANEDGYKVTHLFCFLEEEGCETLDMLRRKRRSDDLSLSPVIVAFDSQQAFMSSSHCCQAISYEIWFRVFVCIG